MESWEPLIYSHTVRSPGNNSDLQLASEVENGPVGLSPLPVESDSISRYTVSEIRRILRHPAGVKKLLAVVGKPTPTHTQWNQVWEPFSTLIIHTSDKGYL